MAKAKKAAAKAATPAADASESTNQGRAVILPNGTRRVDYIRDQYYGKGVERSAIRKALNEMYKDKDGKQTQEIPYQIVFAGTKLSRDDYAAEQKTKVAAAAATKKEAAEAAKVAKKD
jgi:hypothetical protein